MRLVFLKCLLCLCVASGYAAPIEDSPAGVWRGESLCSGGSPSCRDEKVVYYIEAVPGKPGIMLIRADKIVDGKAITMGSGPWQYDAARHTLSWQAGPRLWLLTVSAGRIEGTLTLQDNTVVRRMSMKKDNSL